MENEDRYWRPKVPERPDHKIRPARKHPKWEQGQDFDTLTSKHGRPHGPFDLEREHPYKGE